MIHLHDREGPIFSTTNQLPVRPCLTCNVSFKPYPSENKLMHFTTWYWTYRSGYSVKSDMSCFSILWWNKKKESTRCNNGIQDTKSHMNEIGDDKNSKPDMILIPYILTALSVWITRAYKTSRWLLKEFEKLRKQS